LPGKGQRAGRHPRPWIRHTPQIRQQGPGCTLDPQVA
jgi:hypothetical protein